MGRSKGEKKEQSKGDAGAILAALEELYSAPFEQFVPLRRELALRLRQAGDAAGARELAAAAKPSRTAWALNQVARQHADVIAAVIDAWKEAAAPMRREGASILEAARRYREAVAEAVREARAVLARDGLVLSPAQARRMGETLQALVGAEATQADLRRGRLTRDLAVDDPFAGIGTEGDTDAESESASTRNPFMADAAASGGGPRSHESVHERAPDAPKKEQREREKRERLERETREQERLERERRERARAHAEAKAAVAAVEAEAKNAAKEAQSAEREAQEAQRNFTLAQTALTKALAGLSEARARVHAHEENLARLRDRLEKMAR